MENKHELTRGLTLKTKHNTNHCKIHEYLRKTEIEDLNSFKHHKNSCIYSREELLEHIFSNERAIPSCRMSFDL